MEALIDEKKSHVALLDAETPKSNSKVKQERAAFRKCLTRLSAEKTSGLYLEGLSSGDEDDLACDGDGVEGPVVGNRFDDIPVDLPFYP